MMPSSVCSRLSTSHPHQHTSRTRLVLVFVAEWPIEDDVEEIVELEQEEYKKRVDEDVKSIVLNT